MASNTTMETTVLLTAQDRGMSTLLKKVSVEADASVDAFGRLGLAISGALGGLTGGYLFKKAMSSIDDFRMSVMSVAVTLTDTLRGTTADLGKAFQQNMKHAESFFYLLQKQSTKSLATFEQLQNAYTMFANKGLALTPTAASVKGLASLVDRIVLATKGQNQNIQIIQELRSILNGQARPTDALATLFKGRDANFQQTVKELVSKGDGQKVVEYLNSLIADVDISGELSRNLSKSLSKVQMNLKLWAIQAFSPLHDELAEVFNSIAESTDSGNGGGAAFMRGLNTMAKGVTDSFRALRTVLSGFANSKEFQIFAEMAPTFLAMAAATTSAATAFGLFKAAAMSSLTAVKTVPGMIGMAVAGGYVASEWAGRQAPTRETQAVFEEKRDSESNTEYLKSLAADVVDSAMSLLSGLAISVMGYFKDIVDEWKRAGGTIVASAIDMFAEAYKFFRTTFLDKIQWVVTQVENLIGWLKTQWTNQVVNPIMGMYHGTMALVSFGKTRQSHLNTAREYTSGARNETFTPRAATYGTRTAGEFYDSMKTLADTFRQNGTGGGALSVFSFKEMVDRTARLGDALKTALNSGWDTAVKVFDKRQTAREQRATEGGQEASSAWTLPKQAPAEADTSATKLMSAISAANSMQSKMYGMYRLVGRANAKGDALQSAGEANMILYKIAEIERTALGKTETEADAIQRMEQAQQMMKDNLSAVLSVLKEEEQYYRTLAALKTADNPLSGLVGGVLEYGHDNAKTVYQQFADLAKDAIGAIKETFSDGLYQMFTEGKIEFRSLMASLGQSILKSITDMIAESVVNAGAKAAGSAAGSLIGSFFGAANGAVWQGGFTPVRAFATGGIAKRPTIGLIGEAGMNEAVVPLPDGRSIPVVMKGGGGGNVIVNINDRSGSGTRKSVQESTDAAGNTVLDIVIDAAARNVNGFRNNLRNAIGVEA